jgi:isopentenyl phosphate kinase
MRDRVVVKWGGGLITEKSTMTTVRADILDRLAEQLETCLAHDLDVVLVHGAGSFGHLKAKQYRLAEGRINHQTFEGEMSQDEAVEEVRQDMLTLNSYVMEALTKRDISAVTLPPHQWASNTGPDFTGDLTVFRDAPSGIVLVTYGDVVKCDGEAEFGILSGDDLVVRLAVELPRVKRLVFAMGGVDGVLAAPPVPGEAQELLHTLRKDRAFEGSHATEMDVTGGIGLKVDRGFQVVERGIEVMLVSGEHEQRVADACLGRTVLGTSLLA